MKTKTKTEVIVTPPRKYGSGRREGWYRTAEGLNPNMNGAKRFEGNYLTAGREARLPVGTLVVSVEPEGSASEGTNATYLHEVTPEGGLTRLNDTPYHWRNNFETFSELVEEKLSNKKADPEPELVQALPDSALLRIINGQPFAVIVYGPESAPTVGSYPVENLHTLTESDWRFATIQDVEGGLKK